MAEETVPFLRRDVQWLLDVLEAARALFDEEGFIPFDEPHHCSGGGVELTAIATPGTDALFALTRRAPWEGRHQRAGDPVPGLSGLPRGVGGDPDA